MHADLLQAIQSSYTPCPSAELVESVWDFKKWLEPYIPRLEQHSRYLVYRFTLNDGNAQMHYKRFSDMQWEPMDNGVTIIYVSIIIIHLFNMIYNNNIIITFLVYRVIRM